MASSRSRPFAVFHPANANAGSAAKAAVQGLKISAHNAVIVIIY
jgi:hypothetical protein